MDTTINIYLKREQLYIVLLFLFSGGKNYIVNNKELDIISYFHYNRITYHWYDRKGLKWQGIETHMKLEKKY